MKVNVECLAKRVSETLFERLKAMATVEGDVWTLDGDNPDVARWALVLNGCRADTQPIAYQPPTASTQPKAWGAPATTGCSKCSRAKRDGAKK